MNSQTLNGLPSGRSFQTGAAFNPARAPGPMVATGNFSEVTDPIVGAIVAAILLTGLAPARP
ncbi:aquaporin [Bradyrhizobium sp. 170]|nr:aquaporin [Bradyrhizobium sp. 170]